MMLPREHLTYCNGTSTAGLMLRARRDVCLTFKSCIGRKNSDGCSRRGAVAKRTVTRRELLTKKLKTLPAQPNRPAPACTCSPLVSANTPQPVFHSNLH